MATPLTNVELLRRLVAFDTTSRNSNLPLIDFIADYLDRPGVRVERNLSPDGTKANLAVIIGPEREDRAGLVLSGHTDVVPAGEGWHSDPFTLTEADGRYVARGACDMKGFLALAINRVAAVAPSPLEAPLALVLTYDEEVGTLGARHFAESWAPARALPRRAVIGEPTSLRPVRLHKGHLRLRLTFHGRSAHSGYPHLGVNAIEHAARAIVALATLREELQRERPPLGEHFPEVPFVALNVGQVTGGVAVNVVPERCVLDVGVRLLPGMQANTLIDRVRIAVQQALDMQPAPDAQGAPDVVGRASRPPQGGRDGRPTNHRQVPFELHVVSESPPMALDAAADHLRFLAGETGIADAPGASFATDAGWLQSVGLDCVIFGPGSIEVAHRPDEFLPADQFARADEILTELVHRFCATPEVVSQP